MSWSNIGKDVASVAPIIGSILGGPAGAALTAVGSIVASVLGVEDKSDAVAKAIKTDPSALAKIRKAEVAHQSKLVELQVTAAQNRLSADTKRVQSVNQTMRAESKSEHWAQWLWRPLNGILFGPTILALYVILPAIHISVPDVPITVWEAWGALLGITAWHRGMRQRFMSGDEPSWNSRLGRAMSMRGNNEQGK